MSDAILTRAAPPADFRIAYGADPNQFADVRLPKSKGPFPVLINIHGGFWRAKYDLAHAGHLCAALAGQGIATFNLKYRRVGNEGGGWPGTFADICSAYQFIRHSAAQHALDLTRLVVMGHSAGGQLALCLAAHEPTLRHAISLAGVVNLQRAFELHLSDDAVAEFLQGKPSEVPDHYRKADPAQLSIPAEQWLIHGDDDDVVPPALSHDYVEAKKKRGENVHLVAAAGAGHFDLIDPRSAAWKSVETTIGKVLA